MVPRGNRIPPSITLTLLFDLFLPSLYFHLTWYIYLFLDISPLSINLMHSAESLLLWHLQGMWTPRGRSWIRMVPSGRRVQMARTHFPFPPLPSPGALPDFLCDLEHAQDIAPSLEAQSVTVFSSEWRESAPRGGLEQKARYLPAALSSLFYPTTPQKLTVPTPASRTSPKPVSGCSPLCSSLLAAI